MTAPARSSELRGILSEQLEPLRQRPVVGLAIAAIAGIVWADVFAPPPLILTALGVIAAALSGLSLRRFSGATFKLLLLAVFLLAATAHAWRITPPRSLLALPASQELARLEARVVRVEYRDPRRQRVVAQVPALAQLSLPPAPQLHAGDVLTLEEVLLRGPKSLPQDPQTRQLARQGIHLQGSAERIKSLRHGQPWRVTYETGLTQTRARMLAILTDAMPGPTPETYAALLAGMVYGMHATEIPGEIVELFRRSGTVHLLVVSGSQVSIIALTLIFLVRGTRRILPLWGMLIVVSGLVGLAVLAGMGASISRAVAMAVVMLGAFAWGRRYDFATSVALSALVLCLLDTSTVFHVGAQLTYACAAGVGLALPAGRDERTGWLRRNLAGPAWATLGAWAFSAPIILWHFNSIVLAGAAANLVAVPLSAALLCLGLLAIAGGLLWLPLAIPFCQLSRLLLEVMLKSNELFASLPLATLEGVSISPPWIIAWYAAVCAVALLLKSPPLRSRLLQVRRGEALASGFAVTGAILLLVVLGQTRTPDGLQVHVLNVGAGQTVLVQAPGANVLVDAGASAIPGRADQVLFRKVLPALALRRVRQLDAIIISHAHKDHCNLAARIMLNIPTRRLLLGPDDGADQGWLQMLQTARERGVEICDMQAGGSLRIAQGAALTALEPRRQAAFRDDPVNNNSLVLRLQHGTTRLLLPADIATEGEARLLRDYPPQELRADVLLAPHHGSAKSNTTPFLRAVSPGAVIISCGGGSHAPPGRTLLRLEELEVPVWRTDLHGDITVTSDGREFRVHSANSRIRAVH